MGITYTAALSVIRGGSRRARGLKHDRDGRLKLDAVRNYHNGRCYFHVYALNVGYSTPFNERLCLSMMEVPRSMPSGEMRTALLNLAAITAMEAGVDYVIRHMTPIKGEKK